MLKRISVSLFLGANLCTILLMWLCVALTFVSPDVIPRLSLLTLAFPVFLIVDLLFVIFWLLFKARLVWVPIAGALLIGGFVLDYSPMHLTVGSNTASNDSDISVITFNVGRMTEKEQRTEFMQFINTADADIVCLQELDKRFLRNNKQWIDTTDYHTLQTGNVAILSRFPIISDTLHIDYPTRSNHCFACWIDLRGDSVLLVNSHLESNHLSPEEKYEYTSTIIDPNREAIRSSSRKLMGKLSEAASYRGKQADSICAFVMRNAQHPAIVCGDFNDTPVSYVYQRFARQFTSAYKKAGNGPGFTYSQRSFPVRIDHIFFSDDWECTSCSIDRSVSSSDHYPLIVRLSKKQR